MTIHPTHPQRASGLLRRRLHWLLPTAFLVLFLSDLALAEPEIESIDLNAASATTLATLPGIGPSKAQAIVSFRERRPFRRIEEILRVRGIGRATFRAIRDRIRVGDAPEPSSRRANARSRSSSRASQ